MLYINHSYIHMHLYIDHRYTLTIGIAIDTYTITNGILPGLRGVGGARILPGPCPAHLVLGDGDMALDMEVWMGFNGKINLTVREN